MKKNLSLLAAFLVVGCWAAPASAADHYVSGMAGISWMNDINTESSYNYEGEDSSSDIGLGSGLTLLGAIGCDYGDYRLEAEIGYQKNDVKDMTEDSLSEDFDGDVSVLSLMANGYYDVDLGGVELYATAGVGVAQVAFDGLGEDGSDYSEDLNETTLAYQVGAGLAAPIADNVKLDLRDRYFATTDFTVYSTDMNVDSHSVLLGLRVGF
ncbi:MAG: outer membrane beta-barrel protein [Chlorobium sp.]